MPCLVSARLWSAVCAAAGCIVRTFPRHGGRAMVPPVATPGLIAAGAQFRRCPVRSALPVKEFIREHPADPAAGFADRGRGLLRDVPEMGACSVFRWRGACTGTSTAEDHQWHKGLAATRDHRAACDRGSARIAILGQSCCIGAARGSAALKATSKHLAGDHPRWPSTATVVVTIR